MTYNVSMGTLNPTIPYLYHAPLLTPSSQATPLLFRSWRMVSFQFLYHVFDLLHSFPRVSESCRYPFSTRVQTISELKSFFNLVCRPTSSLRTLSNSRCWNLWYAASNFFFIMFVCICMAHVSLCTVFIVFTCMHACVCRVCLCPGLRRTVTATELESESVINWSR